MVLRESQSSSGLRTGIEDRVATRAKGETATSQDEEREAQDGVRLSEFQIWPHAELAGLPLRVTCRTSTMSPNETAISQTHAPATHHHQTKVPFPDSRATNALGSPLAPLYERPEPGVPALARTGFAR